MSGTLPYAPPIGVPVLSPVIGGNPATGPNTGSPIIQVFHSTTPIQIPTAADGGLLSQPFLIPGPGRVIITGTPGGTGPLGSPLLWTWNGGANFGALNNDLPLIVGSVAALGVPVSTGDQINLASQEPAVWDYLLLTYEPRTILAPPQWSGYVIQGLPGQEPWLQNITAVGGNTLPSGQSGNPDIPVTLDGATIQVPTEHESTAQLLVDATTAVLGANATYTTANAVPIQTFRRLIGTVISDQAGTLYVQQSPNATNWDVQSSFTVAANDAAGAGVGFSVEVVAPYARLYYVNGATAQTTFRLYCWGVPEA
jgi:hypothetical protein